MQHWWAEKTKDLQLAEAQTPLALEGCHKLLKVSIEDLALQTWRSISAVKDESYRHMVRTQRADA